MRVLRSYGVWPLAFMLLSGAASSVMAESLYDDGLRTDTLIDPEIGPKVVPPISQISIINDEEPAPLKRRVITDPYAPIGVEAGAFVLFPSVEVGSVVSSNAARSSTNPKADVALRLRPSVRWESQWSRHSFTGSAAVNTERSLDNTDLSTVGADISTAARLDIRRTTRADFTTQYTLNSTGTENSGVPNSAKGKRLDQTMAVAAGVTHDLGGLEAGLRLGVQRNLFGDLDLVGGGTENNKDRNFTEVTVAARGSFRTGGVVQPFAEVAYVPRIHDKAKDRNGVKRDSQGLRLTAGTTIANGPLWTGDIALTFDVRDYEDPSLDSIAAPGIAANLTWRPTDLTRFEFNSAASLSETIAVGRGATKIWTAGVTGTHALRENLDVTAGLRFAVERATGENSLASTGTVGVNWAMNPYLVWSAGYEGTWFNSEQANGDYTDHRLLASLIIRR
jgi:hypothetical protein